jgi:hypothetical protein
MPKSMLYIEVDSETEQQPEQKHFAGFDAIESDRDKSSQLWLHRQSIGQSDVSDSRQSVVTEPGDLKITESASEVGSHRAE